MLALGCFSAALAGRGARILILLPAAAVAAAVSSTVAAAAVSSTPGAGDTGLVYYCCCRVVEVARRMAGLAEAAGEGEGGCVAKLLPSNGGAKPQLADMALLKQQRKMS